ncbi:MAG: hypothetical protein QXP38_13805 [Nitrososphaerota archaeon]
MDQEEIKRNIMENTHWLMYVRDLAVRLASQDEDFERERAEIEKKLQELGEKEDKLVEMENNLRKQEQMLLNEQNNLERERSDLATKFAELQELEKNLHERESAIKSKESELNSMSESLRNQANSLEEIKVKLDAEREEISKQRADIENMLKSISEEKSQLEHDKKIANDILSREETAKKMYEEASILQKEMEEQKKQLDAQSENVNNLLSMQSRLEELDMILKKKEEELKQHESDLQQREEDIKRREENIQKKENAFRKLREVIFGVGKNSDSPQESFPSVDIPFNRKLLFFSQNFYALILFLILMSVFGGSLYTFRSVPYVYILGVIWLIFIVMFLIYFLIGYLMLGKVKTELRDKYILVRRPLFFRSMIKIAYDDIIGVSSWSSLPERIFGVETIILYVRDVTYVRASSVPFNNPYSISGIPKKDVEKWVHEILKRANLEKVG